MVYVPYISSRLPSYDGPYPVGALDLELPVDKVSGNSFMYDYDLTLLLL